MSINPILIYFDFPAPQFVWTIDIYMHASIISTSFFFFGVPGIHKVSELKFKQKRY